MVSSLPNPEETRKNQMISRSERSLSHSMRHHRILGAAVATFENNLYLGSSAQECIFLPQRVLGRNERLRRWSRFTDQSDLPQ